MYRSHQQQLQIEKKNGDYWIGRKQIGMRAFIASPNRGVGANRSVVLVGSEKHEWKQAVKFWGTDHRERAAAYVEAYNHATAH